MEFYKLHICKKWYKLVSVIVLTIDTRAQIKGKNKINCAHLSLIFEYLDPPPTHHTLEERQFRFLVKFVSSVHLRHISVIWDISSHIC